MSRAGHLARRFAGSLSRRPPEPADEAWAESQLRGHEVLWWRKMSAADRRHAIAVARRFERFRVQPTRDELAAALLHDLGKLDSGLGTFGRVAATVVGAHGQRFRTYHDHERIGADRLEQLGSSAATVALVRREGPAADALAAADDL